MQTHSVRIEAQNLTILQNGEVIIAQTHIGVARGLMSPDRFRRNVGKLLHREVSEVSEQPAGVIQDFGIFGISTRQVQRYLHRFAVALQPGVGSQQLQATHPLQGGIGQMPERLLKSRQRLVVSSQFGEGHRQEDISIRQCGF